MKPERSAYEQAADRAGVDAGDIFFTDDRPENVEGALAAGWQAAIFTSAHDLEETLRGLASGSPDAVGSGAPLDEAV